MTKFPPKTLKTRFWSMKISSSNHSKIMFEESVNHFIVQTKFSINDQNWKKMCHKKRTPSFRVSESGLRVPDSQSFFTETRSPKDSETCSPFERGLGLRDWESFLPDFAQHCFSMGMAMGTQNLFRAHLYTQVWKISQVMKNFHVF